MRSFLERVVSEWKPKTLTRAKELCNWTRWMDWDTRRKHTSCWWSENNKCVFCLSLHETIHLLSHKPSSPTLLFITAISVCRPPFVLLFPFSFLSLIFALFSPAGVADGNSRVRPAGRGGHAAGQQGEALLATLGGGWADGLGGWPGRLMEERMWAPRRTRECKRVTKRCNRSNNTATVDFIIKLYYIPGYLTELGTGEQKKKDCSVRFLYWFTGQIKADHNK